MPPNEVREPALSEEDRPAETQIATKQLDGTIVTPAIDTDRSPLRQALDAAIAESNGSNHEIAQWLADTVATQGLAPMPLLDSGWSFADQCQALIDSKAYRNGGGS